MQIPSFDADFPALLVQTKGNNEESSTNVLA